MLPQMKHPGPRLFWSRSVMLSILKLFAPASGFYVSSRDCTFDSGERTKNVCLPYWAIDSNPYRRSIGQLNELSAQCEVSAKVDCRGHDNECAGDGQPVPSFGFSHTSILPTRARKSPTRCRPGSGYSFFAEWGIRHVVWSAGQVTLSAQPRARSLIFRNYLTNIKSGERVGHGNRAARGCER